MTYRDVEEHFGLKKGCMAVWVQRARQRTEITPASRKVGAPLQLPPLPSLVLLRKEDPPMVHIPRKEPVQLKEPKTPRDVPQGVIARHRALIDRQLTYLEKQDLGTKEYLATHTVYRGLLADWMALPAIDAEKAPSNVPDVSTEEGLTAAVALIASLPEDLIQAALSLCEAANGKG